MTTDRIPTGYDLLDALLGGGLRAGTLTGVLYEDNEACRDAANKVYTAIGKRSGGTLDWYSAQGAPDPVSVRQDAGDRRRVAIIAGPIAPNSGAPFRHCADVILTIRGTHDRTVIEASKNRWGKCDAVAFRWRAGVFNDVEAIDLSRREPEAPSPVAAERARWAEAIQKERAAEAEANRLAGLALDRHVSDSDYERAQVAAREHAVARAEVDDMVRAAIADAKGTP